nr:hypothetical protein CFP56_65443 [Quercus suber]
MKRNIISGETGGSGLFLISTSTLIFRISSERFVNWVPRGFLNFVEFLCLELSFRENLLFSLRDCFEGLLDG